MADYDITEPAEHRLVIVRPGDILVVGRTPALTEDLALRFKEALGLAGISTMREGIDIGSVRYPTADGR